VGREHVLADRVHSFEAAAEQQAGNIRARERAQPEDPQRQHLRLDPRLDHQEPEQQDG